MSFCRWEGYKFMKKLQFVKSKLKEWNKVSFENLKEEKHSFGHSVLV